MQKGETAIQEFCKKQKYAKHVIEGGLEYLIPRWEKIVSEIKNGYTQTIYDYLNDMDCRYIIYKVWSLASEQQIEEYRIRLNVTDKEYYNATFPVTDCIWGSKAAKYKYNLEVHWWYSRIPKVSHRREFLSNFQRN